MDEEIKLDDLFTSQLFMDDDEVDCLSSVLGNFQLKNKLLGPILKKAYKNCLSYLFIYLFSFRKELIRFPKIGKKIPTNFQSVNNFHTFHNNQFVTGIFTNQLSKLIFLHDKLKYFYLLKITNLQINN